MSFFTFFSAIPVPLPNISDVASQPKMALIRRRLSHTLDPVTPSSALLFLLLSLVLVAETAPVHSDQHDATRVLTSLCHHLLRLSFVLAETMAV